MTYKKPEAELAKNSTGNYQQKRLCDNCRVKQPKHTGFMQKFNNGLNQRWICCECKEKIVDF